LDVVVVGRVSCCGSAWSLPLATVLDRSQRLPDLSRLSLVIINWVSGGRGTHGSVPSGKGLPTARWSRGGGFGQHGAALEASPYPRLLAMPQGVTASGSSVTHGLLHGSRFRATTVPPKTALRLVKRRFQAKEEPNARPSRVLSQRRGAPFLALRSTAALKAHDDFVLTQQSTRMEPERRSRLSRGPFG
jgi:hypothetical protein